jgi:hypothetical protein
VTPFPSLPSGPSQNLRHQSLDFSESYGGGVRRVDEFYVVAGAIVAHFIVVALDSVFKISTLLLKIIDFGDGRSPLQGCGAKSSAKQGDDGVAAENYDEVGLEHVLVGGHKLIDGLAGGALIGDGGIFVAVAEDVGPTCKGGFDALVKMLAAIADEVGGGQWGVPAVVAQKVASGFASEVEVNVSVSAEEPIGAKFELGSFAAAVGALENDEFASRSHVF